MAVKAVNETVDPSSLVFTLLVFSIYLRMHIFNSQAVSVSQQTVAIKHAIDEVWKIRAERQVSNALNTRNGLLINDLHDLLLNSNVVI